MEKRRGFVYSTGKASDAASKSSAPKQSGDRPGGSRSRDPRQSDRPGGSRSHDPRQQTSELFARSPLKRKRSPEPLQLSSGGRGRRAGFIGEAEGSQSSAKLAKTDTFDEDDELDDLGAAALEQYELTQRESTLTSGYRRSLTPGFDPIPDIPISHSISAAVPTSTKILDAPKRNTGISQSKGLSSGWRNPYKEATSTLQAGHSDTDVETRIKALQEENFTKDGEVKVLRGEKERLMSELRKKDEQLSSFQTKILSEKRTMEEKLTKEKDTLATKLQFREQELQAKEQELMKLREKLEQQKSTSGGILPKATPTGGSTRPGPAPSRKSEFLSTETFMPLSQMGGRNVTPVQVGQRREVGLTIKEEEKEREVSKKAKKRRSVSPCGLGTAAGPSSKSSATPSVSQKGEQAATKEKSNVGAAASEWEKKNRLFYWDMPCKEPTGAELLMMLVQRDLLEVPQIQRITKLDLDSDVGDSQDQSQSSSDTQTKSSDSPSHQKLTGLLSLLHLDSGSRSASSRMPSFFSSESSVSQSSSEELSSTSTSESTSFVAPPPPSSTVLVDLHGGSSGASTSAATTPIRRSKLHLTKAHTLARTDMTRARTRQPSDLVKSHSASSSPYHLGAGVGGEEGGLLEGGKSSTLVNSINKEKLESSIAGMLRSADTTMESDISSFSFASNLKQYRSLSESLSPSVGDSSTSIISLLKQIAGIICQYHNEQQKRAQDSANSSGFVMDFTVDHWDSVNSPKPKILSSGSTVSSKASSSDLTSPLEGDQQLATQALDILETLVTYSKAVRKQILLKPPEFCIPDSRSSSVLGAHTGGDGEEEEGGLSSSLAGEKIERSSTSMSPTVLELMKVSGRLSELQRETVPESSPERELTPSTPPPPRKECNWKGVPLVQLRSLRNDIGLSGNVWIKRENAGTVGESTGGSSHMTPVHIPVRGSSCGQLFPILLELPVPPWRESLENVNTCLRILTELAADCPEESLIRFSPLFHEDKLGLCLEKDEPQLTLNVLILLTRLVQSPDLADLLCVRSDACLPLTCYQCLVDPPPSDDKRLILMIRVQIVRMVSHILLNDNGSKVIFEKCSCSHELLKSLTALLQKLLDGFYQLSQFSQQQLLLVKETVLLMFVISVYDPYFDTHREQCEYSYVFVLNTLTYLFSTTDEKLQEASLVQELLEYCDEYEDSDDSGDQDKMEEESGRDGSGKKQEC